MNTKSNRAPPGRRLLVWVACCGSLLPLLAHGDQPSTAEAKSLGILESVLHYCGSVDSDAATKLRDKVKELTKGLTQQQVTSLRQTNDYQAAYSSIEEFVGKVDEHNARKVCTESVSQGK